MYTLQQYVRYNCVDEWLYSLLGVQRNFGVNGSNPGLCKIFIYRTESFLKVNMLYSVRKNIKKPKCEKNIKNPKCKKKHSKRHRMEK